MSAGVTIKVRSIPRTSSTACYPPEYFSCFYSFPAWQAPPRAPAASLRQRSNFQTSPLRPHTPHRAGPVSFPLCPQATRRVGRSPPPTESRHPAQKDPPLPPLDRVLTT